MASAAEVLQKIAANLPDNNTNFIAAAKHREVEEIITEYATNIFRVTAVSGTSITDVRMQNRDIAAIIINDFTKNTGWTKSTASSTLNFTDGTTLNNGDSITIFME